jgi:hypothetical protein
MSRGHVYRPPPPPFVGGRQPYTPRKLAPELLGGSQVCYALDSIDSGFSGADFNKNAVGTDVTPGSISPNIDGNSTEYLFAITPIDVPGEVGRAANFNLSVNVSVGNGNVQGSFAIVRTDSNGNFIDQTLYTTEQGLTAGVKTFTHSNIDLGGWVNGDRYLFALQMRNSSASPQGLTITLGDWITKGCVIPVTLPYYPPEPEHRSTFISIVNQWQPDPWIRALPGGRQPYMRRNLSPQLTAVPEDNPPFQHNNRARYMARVIASMQPNPWVYVYGQQEPYGFNRAPASVTGLPADEPPFSHEAFQATTNAIIAMAQPNPWTYNFAGGRQVFTPRKLAPSLLAVRVDEPPFGHEGRWVVTNQIIASMQPNPWVYNYATGGKQPYAPRSLNPAFEDVPVNDPPFGHENRTAYMTRIIASMQPDPWVYLFHGRQQPFQKRNAPPDTIDIPADQPPFWGPGRSAVDRSIVMMLQPNPWTYNFMGGQQVFTPRKATPSDIAVPENNPPFGLTGKDPTTARIIALTQPDPWKYNYGGRQPYSPRRLHPNVMDIRDDDPPFVNPMRRPGYHPIIRSWQPPDPIYALKRNYDRLHAIQYRQVSAWGYLLTWGISEYRTNYPPVAFGGPVAVKMVGVWAWQPNPWTYAFGTGARQPYGRGLQVFPGAAPAAPDNPVPSSFAELQSNAWRPTQWSYLFGPARQPYGRKVGVTPPSIDNPPPLSWLGRQQTWYPQNWTYLFNSRQPYAGRRGKTAAVIPELAPADAFLARTSGLSERQTNAYRALIDGLVADGVWDKLDLLQIPASEDQSTGNMNLVAATPTITLTNSPTWTPNWGYAIEQLTNGISTGFNFSQGDNYEQDSAHIAVWSDRDEQSFFTTISSEGVDHCYILIRSTSDVAQIRVNANDPAEDRTSTDGRGFFLAQRISSTLSQLFRNGVQMGGDITRFSIAVPDAVLISGAASSNIGAISAGGKFTPSEVAAFTARLATYMATVRDEFDQPPFNYGGPVSARMSIIVPQWSTYNWQLYQRIRRDRREIGFKWGNGSLGNAGTISGTSLQLGTTNKAVNNGPIQEGDLLIAIINLPNNVDPGAITCADFTAIEEGYNEQGDCRYFVGYRVAGPAEDGTYDVSWSSSNVAAWTMLCFSGVDTSDPVDVSAIQGYAASQSHTVPSVDPTVENGYWLSGSMRVGANSPDPPTAPIIGLYDIRSNSGGRPEISVGGLQLSNGNATGTGTYVQAAFTQVSTGFSIILKKAP